MADCFGSFAGLAVPQCTTASSARATPQGMACVRPGTVTVSRAQGWLRCGCQDVLRKDANLCSPWHALAGRRNRPDFAIPPIAAFGPRRRSLEAFCARVDLHERGCGGEKKKKTLGGLLSTPSDISKAIRECCLPGSPGASTVLAVTMYGAQVVPIHTVKSKHLTAASCPRWIPPTQATFFTWPLRALPCARGSGDRQQPDFTRRFFSPCSVS